MARADFNYLRHFGASSFLLFAYFAVWLACCAIADECKPINPLNFTLLSACGSMIFVLFAKHYWEEYGGKLILHTKGKFIFMSKIFIVLSLHALEENIPNNSC